MIWTVSHKGEICIWHWNACDGRNQRIACGPTLQDALIVAEKVLRTDLDSVQARLTAERDRLKSPSPV